MSKQNFIEQAAMLAETSEVLQRHAALIVKGGNVIASGVNKIDQVGRNLLKKYGPSDLSTHIHAEAAAICSFLATQKGCRFIRGQKHQNAQDEVRSLCGPYRDENEQAM
jgi:deoxycytidylate deaminase